MYVYIYREKERVPRVRHLLVRHCLKFQISVSLPHTNPTLQEFEYVSRSSEKTGSTTSTSTPSSSPALPNPSISALPSPTAPKPGTACATSQPLSTKPGIACAISQPLSTTTRGRLELSLAISSPLFAKVRSSSTSTATLTPPTASTSPSPAVHAEGGLEAETMAWVVLRKQSGDGDACGLQRMSSGAIWVLGSYMLGSRRRGNRAQQRWRRGTWRQRLHAGQMEVYRVSHLLFMDDVLLFAKSNVRSLPGLCEMFTNFGVEAANQSKQVQPLIV